MEYSRGGQGALQDQWIQMLLGYPKKGRAWFSWVIPPSPSLTPLLNLHPQSLPLPTPSSPRASRTTPFTHCLSFLSSGALRARKSPITLLALLPRGPNQSDETWVTLKKGTGGQGGTERRHMDAGEGPRGSEPRRQKGLGHRV